ncbi:MAG TPA: right-handed parallel beta-helix repeat-containing protein, partial [Herpetosiphonaceae bacterium]|nr:right-handed parallel beta-helix repeat-containing protein [Herpetosiphonaceae bacterium]
RAADDQVEQAKGIFIHVPTLAHGTQYPQPQAPPKALPPPAPPRALPAPPAILGRTRRPPVALQAGPAETQRLPAAEPLPATGPTTPLAPVEGIGYQPAHMALAATNFTVDTGSSVTTTVSVINRSSVVDRINLAVAGIPAAWVNVIPESLPLLPGAQSEAQLIITPPRHPSSAAGTSHFRVLGRSDKRPDQQAFAAGVLTVRPYTDFKTDIFPKERKVRRQGVYQVQVANKSNQPQVFHLQGSNDEELLDFQFSQPDLTVPAGEVRKTELRVRLRNRRIIGTSQMFPLLVSATPGDQVDLVQQAPARLADKPLVPQWLLQTVLLPILALVILLVTLNFRTDITRFIRNLFNNSPAATAPTVAPAGSGAGTAGGAAGATPTGTLSLAPAAPPQVPITTEVRWTVADSPIVLRTNQTVPAGTRLTIDPGVDVRFDSRVSLEIQGNLVVNGTRELPVRFGSSDGGSWDGIYIRPGGQANILGAEIDNAGAKGVTVLVSQGVLIIRDTTLTNNRAGVLAFDSYVEIQRAAIKGNRIQQGALLAISLGAGNTLALVDSVVRDNTLAKDAASAHVLLNGAPERLEIANNLFDNAGGIGVLLDASAGYSATVSCNTFASSAIGLAVNLRSSLTDRPAPQVALADNAFLGNQQYGIYSVQALDARNTWWGDPSGPADPRRNSAGSGSAASELVTIDPWSSAAPSCAPPR